MKIIVKDAALLKETVLKAGYTQRSFGRTIGISEGYAIQICNGDRNPGPEVAKKITDILNGTFDDFFYIENACNSTQKKRKSAS